MCFRVAESRVRHLSWDLVSREPTDGGEYQTIRIYVRDIGEHPGGLKVDCDIRTRNESKVGDVSRDGVQRKMRGSYGYSVSKNTQKPNDGQTRGFSQGIERSLDPFQECVNYWIEPS